MTIKTYALAGAIALGLLLPAAAQMSHDGHGTPAMDHGAAGMDHGAHGATAVRGDQGPSSKAFAEANAKMHAAMDITFSGDADVDFVKGMIAHHEGAIDMARILLEHGKDPELRALAEGIIAAQESEVATMRAWLAAKGVE